MTKTLQFILTTLFLIALIYVGYHIVTYLIGILAVIDKQIAAAIVAASTTILTAVGGTLYAQKRAKERELFEAHRQKKIEVYSGFMDTIASVLKKSKSGDDTSSEAFAKEYEDFFIHFTKDVIVWGSPEFIKAYEGFRAASKGKDHPLLLTDDMLQAIRKDLGNSNKGIKRGDLIKLYIINPEELDTAIENTRIS